MSLFKITDNHSWVNIDDCFVLNEGRTEADKENLLKISNIDIKNLKGDDESNILVFPKCFSDVEDKIGERNILSVSGDRVSTGNIMGFVGVNETQVNICSRFAKEDKEDYFLHYMLQKVFSINLFDIKHATSSEAVFDFLIYLFPFFLKKAVSQGIFRKYARFEHNDANVKGVINVVRHIKENIPFSGRIAYYSRELSYDNEITQLIRHTIEYIKGKPMGNNVLYSDVDTKGATMQIMSATPTYNVHHRQKVINENLRMARHPYFTAYTTLQKICLQILKHDEIKYGTEKDKVYGILFDGAWLWEEYLNTILKPIGFKHPKNKLSEGGFRMFSKDADDELFAKNSRRLYPDFYRENCIVDAKYKHLNNGVGREDLYQVVTYMYCKRAEYGAYIYPYEKQVREATYKLNGYGGQITVIPFYVPQDVENWNEFIKKIEKSELATQQCLPLA